MFQRIQITVTVLFFFYCCYQTNLSKLQWKCKQESSKVSEGNLSLTNYIPKTFGWKNVCMLCGLCCVLDYVLFLGSANKSTLVKVWVRLWSCLNMELSQNISHVTIYFCYT